MISYVLLSLSFVPLVLSGVVQIPVRHLIVSGVTVPHNQGNFVEYRTIDVSIGTPAQRFNLTLNTYGYFAHVFDTSLQGTLYTFCSGKGTGGRRHLFDAQKSSTYGNVADSGYPFDLLDFAYFDYCDSDDIQLSNGDVAMDKVQVGALSASAYFGVITAVNADLQPFWASDGVFGLTRPNPDADVKPTYADLAKAATGRAVVTLAGGELNSTLTLGGDDTVNCDGNWTVFPQAGLDWLGDWHFRVKAAQLGRYSSTYATVGTVGTFTKTRVPKPVFGNFVKWIGAEYDFKSDEYVVACSSIPSMPDLVLHLDNGYDYRMPANVYVSTIGRDNKCILMLEENILIDQNFYTLGWHALTRKCWRFDYSADTFSFADAKL